MREEYKGPLRLWVVRRLCRVEKRHIWIHWNLQTRRNELHGYSREPKWQFGKVRIPPECPFDGLGHPVHSLPQLFWLGAIGARTLEICRIEYGEDDLF